MNSRQTKTRTAVWPSFFMITVFFLLSACGGGEGASGGPGSDTGSIVFRLVWQNTAQHLHNGPPSGDVCVDYGVESIDVRLTDQSDSTVASPSWPCSDHGGTIKDVAQGSGYTVTVAGMVAANADWRGQATGITVIEDQVNDAGTIEMTYRGGDKTPPYVISHYPDSEASGIYLNSAIAIKFSENVVAASVNSTSCILTAKGAAVHLPGTISYDAESHVVTLTPDSNLEPQSDYTVRINTIVEDLAGLHLSPVETWNFTTGEVVGRHLKWNDRHWNITLWN